jgi:hypothetical protein
LDACLTGHDAKTRAGTHAPALYRRIQDLAVAVTNFLKKTARTGAPLSKRAVWPGARSPPRWPSDSAGEPDAPQTRRDLLGPRGWGAWIEHALGVEAEGQVDRPGLVGQDRGIIEQEFGVHKTVFKPAGRRISGPSLAPGV